MCDMDWIVGFGSVIVVSLGFSCAAAATEDEAEYSINSITSRAYAPCPSTKKLLFDWRNVNARHYVVIDELAFQATSYSVGLY